MRHCLAPLLISIAAFGTATWIAPSRPGTATAAARNLVRPLVLPFLWRGAAEALRNGRIGETVTRGRNLLRLLPEWTDGHILFAQMLAFNASQRASSAEAALDRLLAAIALLREAAKLWPADAATFLSTEAFFLEQRIDHQPELATLFRARVGREPLAVAAACMKRAASISTQLDVRVDWAFLAKRMIRPAMTSGDPQRVQHSLAVARRLLAEAARDLRASDRRPAAANADANLAALDELARYLAEGRSLQPLRDNPYLEDVLPPF